MSRRLDDLDVEFRLIVFELLARLCEAGIPVMIISTRRTPEEQAAALAAGRSWTTRSRHLVGMAIDVCPYAIFQLHGSDKLAWDASDPAWQTMGKIAKQMGLRCGMDWAQRDMGHFELPAEDRHALPRV